LLNAGHKQGACAYRCERDGNAVRPYKAFAPAVLAGIGELPQTLHDRSIRVWLMRAAPEQIAQPSEPRTEGAHSCLPSRGFPRSASPFPRRHSDKLRQALTRSLFPFISKNSASAPPLRLILFRSPAPFQRWLSSFPPF